MCTALAAAKKINDKTGGPLGLAVAQNLSPLGIMDKEDDPLAISPAKQIVSRLK